MGETELGFLQCRYIGVLINQIINTSFTLLVLHRSGIVQLFTGSRVSLYDSNRRVFFLARRYFGHFLNGVAQAILAVALKVALLVWLNQ